MRMHSKRRLIGTAELLARHSSPSPITFITPTTYITGVIPQHLPRRRLQIIELPCTDGPEERPTREDHEHETQGDEDEEDAHGAVGLWGWRLGAWAREEEEAVGCRL